MNYIIIKTKVKKRCTFLRKYVKLNIQLISQLFFEQNVGGTLLKIGDFFANNLLKRSNDVSVRTL